jgi:hypothetical protein
MGWTPLQFLLRYGADCTIKDKSFKYAFDLIAKHEDRQTLQQQEQW